MSDPTVQAMNEAQWLFEYYALRKREEDEGNFFITLVRGIVTNLREMLIGLLGLNVIKRWVLKPGETAPDVTPFVPLSFLVSKPEMLKHYIDEGEKDDTVVPPEQDAAFEAWSAKLARGDVADMDPILIGTPNDDKNLYWRTEAAQQALKAMGVRSTPGIAQTGVPHYTVKKDSDG